LDGTVSTHVQVSEVFTREILNHLDAVAPESQLPQFTVLEEALARYKVNAIVLKPYALQLLATGSAAHYASYTGCGGVVRNKEETKHPDTLDALLATH